jgi:hypothetical protein
MISMSSEAQDSVHNAAIPHSGGGAPRPQAAPALRATVTAHGVTATERETQRAVLQERLTGDDARNRATSPEPQGAGLTREAVEKIEYTEIWSNANPSDGYDFRMYSFGGALVATRSTRAR